MRRLAFLLYAVLFAVGISVPNPKPAHASGGGSVDVAPTATSACVPGDCWVRAREFDVTDRSKVWVKEYHTSTGIWTSYSESFGSLFVIAGNESETYFRYTIDSGGNLWCYQPSGPSQGWHLALTSVFLDIDAKRATPGTVQNTSMNHYVVMLRNSDDSVMLTPGLLVCGPNTPYTNIGGGTNWSPAVTQMSDGAHVVVTGTAGDVWQYTAGGGWVTLGGGSVGSPGAVSWDHANRFDAFVRGTDNALWHKVWDGSSWSTWASLGGGLASGPGCASWAANRIDCFVIGTDGTSVWHIAWDGNVWAWEGLG